MMSTSFHSSYYKAKRIKLLLEELPTIQFLTHTASHLYDVTWCCVWCPFSESFKHIWTCSNRLLAQHQVISVSMQKLIHYFSVVCLNITSQHPLLIQLFAHLT